MKIVRYNELAQWPKPSKGDPASTVHPAAIGCIPFKQGSALGWQIFPPFDATIRWLGGTNFQVNSDDELKERLWIELMREGHGWPTPWWCSKIEGVLQIDPGFSVITPPRIKTLLTGPFNRPSPAYWAHTGLMDTDW